MHPNELSNFIFLGGSCNPTTWRREVAIPLLENCNIKYFNPQVSRWRPELIEIENQAKQIADVLFFVLDNQTRSIAAMIEVAELSTTNRKLICVINEFFLPDTLICGEAISFKEYEDLKKAQRIVKVLFERQGVPVFTNLIEGIIYATQCIKKDYSTDELISDLKQNYFTKYLKFSEKVIKLKQIFRSLDISNLGKIGLFDVKYVYRLVTGLDLTEDILSAITFCQLKSIENNVNNENIFDLNLNFEQFCYLFSIYDHMVEQQKKTIQFDLNNRTSILNANRNEKHVLPLNNLNQVNSHTLTKPLQKIVDWFSGFSHHNHHLNNHNNHNNQKNYSKHNLRSSLFVHNSNRNKGNEDVVDFASSNRTSFRILDEHKHVYPFQVECRDIYLGGTTSTSKWREDIAIPILKKHHITFYYPFENIHNEKINPYETNAILNSRVLLFVITSDCRSLSSMLMAAHCIAKGYRVVLCVEYLRENCFINGEKISEIAKKDYNRGRDYLVDLAKRHKKPVYSSIIESVESAIDLSKSLKKSHF